MDIEIAWLPWMSILVTVPLSFRIDDCALREPSKFFISRLSLDSFSFV